MVLFIAPRHTHHTSEHIVHCTLKVLVKLIHCILNALFPIVFSVKIITILFTL
jgi:hypothetical protein